MENENITASVNTISGNAAIDNVASIVDNPNQVENNEQTYTAELSGSEDTVKSWQEIIEVKDGIISAYESQVSSLKDQIANLVRNGAYIQEQNNDDSQKAPSNNGINNPFGGFGHDVSMLDDFKFSDLGKDIGKRD